VLSRPGTYGYKNGYTSRTALRVVGWTHLD
jgi:hypothetical protein